MVSLQQLEKALPEMTEDQLRVFAMAHNADPYRAFGDSPKRGELINQEVDKRRSRQAEEKMDEIVQKALGQGGE